MNEVTRTQLEQRPIGAASDWVEAVLRAGSLATAWPLTDPDMRKDLAAAWVANHREHPILAGEDPEVIVEELTSPTPGRLVIWDAFDRSGIAYLRSEMVDVDLDAWSWVTNPNPVGADLEAVLFVDPGPLDEEGRPLEPVVPGGRPALAFMMHLVDGAWLVSAVSAPASPLPAP
jgi:hypothetical protein